MKPSLEDRLRAHYADRTARETFSATPPTKAASIGPPGLRRRRTVPLLLAAASIVAVAGVTGAVLSTHDGGSDKLDVIAPDESSTTVPSTSIAASTTMQQAPTTTVAVHDSSQVRSVILSADGVLGSWNGHQWVPWQEAIPVDGNEVYAVIGAEQPQTSRHGEPMTFWCEESTPYVGYGLEHTNPWSGAQQVAVSGVSEPLPRPVTVLSPDSAEHVAGASNVLKQLGVVDPQPSLRQVLQADLDGDGTEEVLVVAERGDIQAQPGDYSVMILRRVVDGRSVDTVLASSVVTESAEQGGGLLITERIDAIVDLNGDGRMEIVRRKAYIDGWGSAVYEWSDGVMTRVLHTGCGGY